MRIALFTLLVLSFFIPRATRVIIDWAEPTESAGIGEAMKPVQTLQKGTPVRPCARIISPGTGLRLPPPATIHAPATSSQLRLIAVESQPTYLKIRLLGSPKSHRSPPAA